VPIKERMMEARASIDPAKARISLTRGSRGAKVRLPRATPSSVHYARPLVLQDGFVETTIPTIVTKPTSIKGSYPWRCESVQCQARLQKGIA